MKTPSPSHGPARPAACSLALLLAAASVVAQAKKPPASGARETLGAAPRISLAVGALFDRRSNGFPSPELTVAFTLEGEDARGVLMARARVTRAVDDTGKNLVDTSSPSSQRPVDWQHATESEPPQPRITLVSPARKAKTLTSLEGVFETYSPSRDPASTVTIERILAKKDKPLSHPALAGQRIRLQVLSKAALEEEKQLADAKKKAEMAKKPAREGVEGVADALTETLVANLERMLMIAGDNDLILKVDDPGAKIFSFDLATPDGKPVHSYGTSELEGYRIVRMFQPVPEDSSLLVRLKTPRASSETPFTFTGVRLP